MEECSTRFFLTESIEDLGNYLMFIDIITAIHQMTLQFTLMFLIAIMMSAEVDQLAKSSIFPVRKKLY